MAIFLLLNVIVEEHILVKSLQIKDYLGYFSLTNMIKIKDVGGNEASGGGTGSKDSGRPVTSALTTDNNLCKQKLSNNLTNWCNFYLTNFQAL